MYKESNNIDQACAEEKTNKSQNDQTNLVPRPLYALIAHAQRVCALRAQKGLGLGSNMRRKKTKKASPHKGAILRPKHE